MAVQIRNKQLPPKAKLRTPPDPIRKLKIWVLYPYLETEDPNLLYYYDFSQSLAEYTRVFEALGADWLWERVTLQNYQELIATIRKRSGRKLPLVFNLCDGDEVNGTPGISVIRELEKHRLIYTGSDTKYYEITTSKIPMKEAFDRAGVPTAPWAHLKGLQEPAKETDGETGEIGRATGQTSVEAGPRLPFTLTNELCSSIGTPLIIKPAVSGGSMGVSVKNVVHTDELAAERVTEICKGYRGWDLLADGLIAERFVTGREFTTLVVGSSDQPGLLKVYAPVERVFHPSLPEEERFLSFDRLWEIYEEEQAMPGEANFYNYQEAPDELKPALEQISIDAYRAVGGMGYGRLDIRLDSATGKLYVLEVNAQCGLSEDENFTSIGAILRFSGKSFSSLVRRIIDDAFRRRQIKY